MNCCRTFLAVTFIAMTFGILSFGTANAQNLRPWTVKSVSGDVRHKSNGDDATALKSGSSIGIGSTVSTGENARVVLARGTESITMSPKSEISIPPATGNMLTRIVQNLGTLLLKVEKRPDQHFEVKTPYLAAVVKGTTFTVSVNKENSAVHVVSGLVQVNDLLSGQSGLVQPGRTGVVTSKPGGGLKISGGRTNGKSKHAKAKVEKTELAKKSTNGASGNTGKSTQKPGAKKSAVGKAASSGIAKKTAKTSAKFGKGLAITKALGITKINIVALTNGFIQPDRASGVNAGSASIASAANDDKGKGNGNATGKNPGSNSNSNAGGNGNSNAGGNGNSNAGGNGSAGGNGGGNAGGNGNAGGSSVASVSPGNSGGNPGGGNAGGGNAGGNGNAGGSSVASVSPGNSGGNPGGGNAGGGNAGGNPGGGNAGGNPGGGNAGGNPGGGNAGAGNGGGNAGAGNGGGNAGGGNAGGNAGGGNGGGKKKG